MSRNGNKIIFYILIIWLLFITRTVFLTTLLPLFTRLFFILGHILLLLLLVIASWVTGGKILQIFKVNFSSFSEEFSFSVALGMGLWAYLTLFLGAMRLYYPLAIYILLFLFLFSSPSRLKNFFLQTKEAMAKMGEEKITPFHFSLFILLGLTLFIIFSGTFTPPFSYDALAYHLGVPKLYLKSHRLIPLPYNVYSNFPYTVEMLYTSALLLWDEGLAKMMHLLLGLLTAAAIFSFTSRRFSPRTGLLAAVIFFNIPWVGQISGVCYNDLGLTLFIFLAIIAFLQGEKERKWLWISGVFTGLAIGTKYTGIIFCFLFLYVAVWVRTLLRREGAKRALKNSTLFSLIALGVASPWFIKNLIFTGNPLFPFFYSLWGGKNWSPLNAQRFAQVHLPSSTSLFDTPLLLWKLFTNYQMSFLFLLFLPLFFFLRKKDKGLKFFLLFFAYYFLVWVYRTHRVDRFILPAYSFLSVIIACTIFQFQVKGGMKVVLVSVVSLLLSANFLLLTLNAARLRYLPAILGLDTREEFFLRIEEESGKTLAVTPLYQGLEFANRKLPPGAKILFIGENQTYYCQRPLLSNSPLDKNIIVEIANKARDKEEMLEQLKKMGITHILYNESEVARVKRTYNSFNWKDEKAEERFNQFRQKFLRKIYEKEGVIIYEILYNGGKFFPPK